MNEVREVRLCYCLDIQTLRKLRKFLKTKNLESYSNEQLDSAIKLMALNEQYEKGLLSLNEYGEKVVSHVKMLAEV